MKSFTFNKFIISFGIFTLIIIVGCKKLDLVRIAYVKTNPTTNILSNSATFNGEIIDLGEGTVKDHGFCWSTSGEPTIDDIALSGGPINSTDKISAPADSIVNIPVVGLG